MKTKAFTVCAIAFLFCGVANAGLNDGLVVHWSFDDCTAKDISGNGHDGFIGGNPQCIDGVSGKAFNFNGSSDFITTNTYLGINLKEKTLVAWVKLNDLEQQGGGVVGIQTDPNISDNFDSIVYGETTKYHWITGSSWFERLFEAPFVEQSNKWILMAITYKDNNYSIYRNASLIGNTTAYAAQQFDTDSIFYVGKRHSFLTGPINAQIDEARLYNRVLSASEVQQIYQEGSPNQYLGVTAIPDVDNDGKSDQAILTMKADQCYLQIISTATGKQLKRIPLGANLMPIDLTVVDKQISILMTKSNGINVLQLRNSITGALVTTINLQK